MSISKIEKPWGYEEIIEKNNDYVVKKLFMKKGHRCSLQYHNFKHETFYVLGGKLKFTVGNSEDNLNNLFLNIGDHYTIDKKVIHRMEAIEDAIYLECSTNYLEDVIRINDDYSRI